MIYNKLSLHLQTGTQLYGLLKALIQMKEGKVRPSLFLKQQIYLYMVDFQEQNQLIMI